MPMDFHSKEIMIVYINHSWIQRQFIFYLYFSHPLLYEESFTLYILLWTIFTLHLLIIQALT